MPNELTKVAMSDKNLVQLYNYFGFGQNRLFHHEKRIRFNKIMDKENEMALTIFHIISGVLS
jgi:hypothetical protein